MQPQVILKAGLSAVSLQRVPRGEAGRIQLQASRSLPELRRAAGFSMSASGRKLTLEAEER